jgi:exodeoxyribonuclease VII large subunit
MSDLFDLPFDEHDEPEGADDAGVRNDPRRIFTVTEVTTEIRRLMEGAFAGVWIEGEVSNCRPWTTGHVYFTLKDSSAQLKAVMWKSAARFLKFKMEDGLHVIARGRLTVYEPKGEYQIVCDQIEPKGLGALQLALEQLKKRLHAEGLLDLARKRPLPTLPRKIGIVTSIDGAALRDIIKVLSRRYPNAHLVIAPTRVQGEGAAIDIAKALDNIGRVEAVDVIIVGRGGGSIEDLWAFNEEAVARAIVRAPVPVISAVGHEVDVTLADLVADLRAPTPSAAAEVVVAAKNEFVGRIDRLAEQLRAAMLGRVRHEQHLIQRVEGRPAFAGFPARLALRGRHITELQSDLQRAARGSVARRMRTYQTLRDRLESLDVRRTLGRVQKRLAHADAKLAAAITTRTHAADATLGRLAARLDALSPLAVLGRGYAVCWDAAHTAIVRDAAAIEPGAGLRITLHRGELSCVVQDRTLAPDRPDSSAPAR